MFTACDHRIWLFIVAVGYRWVRWVLLRAAATPLRVWYAPMLFGAAGVVFEA